MNELLFMRQIVKDFSGVRAVDHVNLDIQRGEILALCGENGSGKSTLMKILSGFYPHGTFEGEINFDGKSRQFFSLNDAAQAGIVMIHQEISLVQQLSISANISLGREIVHFGQLDEVAMYKRADEAIQQLGLSLDPQTPIHSLGVGHQQLIEIAKALSKNAQLLILDEPTAALTDRETEILLEQMRNLRNRGISCIFISHRMEEISEIADRVCIIRDGIHIGTKHMKDTNKDEIVAMMVGREITQLYPEKHKPDLSNTQKPVLEVKNLSAWPIDNPQRKRIDDVSFEIYENEILGIAGLVGAGRTELLQSIYGCFKGRVEATILKDGEVIQINNCRDALKLGIAMVPEDRRHQGIIPQLGVGENINLAILSENSWLGGIIKDVDVQQQTSEMFVSMRVKAASQEQPISSLSGGNQQKAILARYLLVKPKILLLDEPTRGVDVGAKQEIYQLIVSLAQNGVAVILVSSELPELLGLSHRVIAFHEGQSKGILDNDNLSQEEVMACVLK